MLFFAKLYKLLYNVVKNDIGAIIDDEILWYGIIRWYATA